jgi:hypothetical protein
MREDLTRDALKEEKKVEKIKKIHFQVHDMLKNSWEKHKSRPDHHKIKSTFRVGDRVWLQVNKERLHGHDKKIKYLGYGPFVVLEKMVDNAYILNLPPYMHIYSLYEPSTLDQEEEKVLPSIEYLASEFQEKLEKDTIL